MKKFLVALMVICIALSCFGFAVFAEEAPEGDAANANGTPTKTVESLVGTYYLQGECGHGTMPGGGTYKTDYDWTLAEQFGKILNGTNRVPFYAGQKEDGSVFFDRMTQQAFKYEMEYAIAAGIDFIAYRYYPGFGTVGGQKKTLQFMNNQLKLHSTIAGQAVGFSKPVDFALVLDEDFNAAKDADLIIDEYMVVKGYLTAADGRPVVFILWNDKIQTQISSTNKKLAKVIADGHDPKKKAPATLFDESIDSMYVVALNAPSYEEAIAAGADAVSWYEGSGSNGEAYTAMTQKVEANWSTAEKVVPNVVTGFDKTLLASNPIEITMKKYASDKATSVRYSRTGTAADSVAAATPEELVNHIKNAVATTNKPADFGAVMVYAWDDFAGGAYLCPTKTDTEFEYEISYLKAMREYFYGTAEGGFPAMAAPYGPEATATATPGPDGNGNADGFSLFGLDTVASIAILVGAVVVIAVFVLVIVSSSKKKAPAKKEEPKAEEPKAEEPKNEEE